MPAPDEFRTAHSESDLLRAEIARFAAVTVVAESNDRDAPHIHVWEAGKNHRLSIPEAAPLSGEIGDRQIQDLIKGWFDLIVPGSDRLVSDLAYDQWLRVRNGQPPEKVPTPDQIKLMERKGPARKQLGPRPCYNHYAIDHIASLSGNRLRVFFENGEVRIADIGAMRGDNPMFAEAFQKFDQVKFRAFDVYWEVGDNTIEIEDRDLWGAGVLETVP